MSNCGTFTLDHYMYCWDKGTTTAPSTPAAADHCEHVPGGTSPTSDVAWVHRSNMAFGFKIFACDDADCTDLFGSYTTSPYEETIASGGNVDDSTTAAELWVLEDVADYSDTDRAVGDPEANATAAMFYPTDFSDAGYLGLWYSTKISGIDTIRFKKASSSGWQNFNTTTWSTVSTLAQEPEASGSGDYHNCSHPWVFPMDDGTTRKVRLMVRCGEETGQDYQIFSIDSTSDAGTDFALGCATSGGCTAGGDTCPQYSKCDWDGGTPARTTKVLGNSGGSSDFYLDESAHGRAMWDYVAYGGINFSSQSPGMVFTGTRTSSCDTASPRIPDIVQATWGSSVWSVPTSGTCTVFAVEDRHDPGTIPLPNGGFKMYYRNGATTYHVIYWNGSVWEDEQDITIAFEGYSTEPSPTLDSCLNNIDTFILPSAGGGDEGAFFKAHGEIGVCFGASNKGLVFAEHRN